MLLENPSTQEGDRLITDSELEHILCVAAGWAAKDRCGKALFPHVKIGRCVRYRLSDVQRVIEASVRRSTSDVAA